MEFFDSIHRYEGLAINRAPFFDGSDYIYWKTRMRVFLQSENVEIWDVIEEGPFVPTKLVDGRSVKKPTMAKGLHLTTTKLCIFSIVL